MLITTQLHLNNNYYRSARAPLIYHNKPFYEDDREKSTETQRTHTHTTRLFDCARFNASCRGSFLLLSSMLECVLSKGEEKLKLLIS
uniref:Uncharacterized protein n=1 Tax=Anopheles quadriannulatus TaxID=34691 RepID=A0A182XTZ8_ANOQN